ncbi:MAG: DUF308 domain-containing protein [Candidatus Sulfotelmatobacter sp.]
MAQVTAIRVARPNPTLSILWGVLLVVLGMAAMAAPLFAAVAVSVIIAWLIVFAGVVHIALAFHAHGAGTVIWRVLVGLAYLCFGAYMLVHPVLGVASLTLVLAALFVIEGILNLVLFFRIRGLHGATWVLIDAIVTLLLGGMIYLQWPWSATWAIGVLVGVSLIMSGVARIAITAAARRAEAGETPTKLAA